jgi:4-amino-4-deoxy-L-arabinose transferase-like glycosyltransferase
VNTRLLLAAACAAPRLLYLAAFGSAGAEDGYYIRLAGSLVQSGTLGQPGDPMTRFEPLYPTFLAIARFLTGDRFWLIAVVQIAVCCVAALLLYELCLRLTRSRAAAVASTLLFAVHPYLIRQSVAWMEISLLSMLLLAVLVTWDRIGRAHGPEPAVACGLLFGLAILTRAMVTPLWIAAIIVLVLRRQMTSAILVAATALALMAPFAARNYRLDGSLLPTRSGENLFVGNNEYADRFIPRYDLDLLPDHGVQVARARLGVSPDARVSPRELDRALTSAAFEFMREHPWRTLRLKLLNVLYFFDVRLVPIEPAGEGTTVTLGADGRVTVLNPRRRSTAASLAHSAVYAVILTGALMGLYLRRHQWRRDVLLLATLAVFAGVASIYFPTTRMRAPVDPILMVYAGCAAAAIRARVWHAPRP